MALGTDGLVQEAVSISGSTEEVDLIRAWFRKDRERRANLGNFGSKAFEHRSLPGRDELEKLVPKMTITVEDIDGGARLTFATTDPTTIEQLGVWSTALAEERASRA